MTIRMIIKKWYVILLCAVIAAAGLYIEKSRVSPVVPQSGDMTYVRVVKFTNVPVSVTNQTTTEIDLTQIAGSWTNLADFIEDLDADYDMKKVNTQWETLPSSQKLTWMNDHFKIQKIGPGMYELALQFAKKDPKDADYLEDNHVKLLDSYEDYFKTAAAMVTSDTNMTTVKEAQLVDDNSMEAAPAKIEKKYAVIGFVLGALVGVVIVMAWNQRKVKVNESKGNS